tara:strand:+ start:2346 stop:2651 length:306 start_codon:yes stop_codon:yes gene_type:complete
MVKIRYKGTKPSFGRNDGGRVLYFQPNRVYEFDENNKRFKGFVKSLLAQPELYEVQTEVGTKEVGKGVRTGRKPSRSKTQKKVDAALKKPKGLKKGKGKAK